ncbi:MAG: hypothetical protein ACQ9CV_08270 [Nitrosopumilus sp.]|jgi:hypothetical protein
MKTTYTVAAIAMFAVVLGLGVLSPALAAKDKIDLCHYSAEETILVDTTGDGVGDTEQVIPEHWKIINISQKGNAVNAHESNHAQDNGDGTFTSDFQIAEDDADALADCTALMEAFPAPVDEDEEEGLE